MSNQYNIWIELIQDGHIPVRLYEYLRYDHCNFGLFDSNKKPTLNKEPLRFISSLLSNLHNCTQTPDNNVGEFAVIAFISHLDNQYPVTDILSKLYILIARHAPEEIFDLTYYGIFNNYKLHAAECATVFTRALVTAVNSRP